MTKQASVIAKRTNEELIQDWQVMDALTEGKGVTPEQATVRGLLMDEIEKRWPKQFDKWIDECHIDDNIESYIGA